MIYDIDGNQLLKIVTPEMYGAKGDGVTDDGQAIQTALSGGGKIVFFAQKTYCVRTRCNIYSNTKIIGNNTKILAYVNPFTIGESGDYAYAYDGSNNVEIIGLDIDLNGIGTDHLIMAHAQNVTVRDCIFRNNAEHAIELNSSKNVTFDNCVFKAVAPSVDKKEAINIDPAATGHTLNMGYFDNTISDCVKIINCLFEDCWAAIGNHGETPYASMNIIMSNCDIRSCYRGAHLHSYKNVIIKGCLFSDIDDIVIRMVGTENVQIIGNQSDSIGKFVNVEGADENGLIMENIVTSDAATPISISGTASGITAVQNIVNNVIT